MRNLSIPFLLSLGHGLEGLLHLVLKLMGEAGGKPVALACLQVVNTAGIIAFLVQADVRRTIVVAVFPGLELHIHMLTRLAMKRLGSLALREGTLGLVGEIGRAT